jgi:hypothetical protein
MIGIFPGTCETAPGTTIVTPGGRVVTPDACSRHLTLAAKGNRCNPLTAPQEGPMEPTSHLVPQGGIVRSAHDLGET